MSRGEKEVSKIWVIISFITMLRCRRVDWEGRGAEEKRGEEERRKRGGIMGGGERGSVPIALLSPQKRE